MRRFSLLVLSACSLTTSLDDLVGHGVPRVDAGMDASEAASPADAGSPLLHGTVVDELGNPIAAATVAIGANNQTTNSSGIFSLAAGSVYDAVVVAPTTETTSGKRVRSYRGLTTRTPTLEVPGPRRVAPFTLTVTGATFPLPAAERVFVSVKSTTKTGLFQALMPTEASSSASVGWNGASLAAGQLFAWDVVVDGQGFPTTWKSASPVTTFSFTDGAASSATVSLGEVVNVTPFTGTFDYSAATAPTAWVAFGAIGGSKMLFGVFGGAPTSVSFPVASGGTESLIARGGRPSGAIVFAWKHDIVGLKPSAALKLPTEDFVVTGPANAATGVDSSTTFSWPAVGNSVYLVGFVCGGVPYAYQAELLTAATSASIPQTSALGVSLPAATSCTWTVTALAPVADVDELAGPAGWTLRSNVFGGIGSGSSIVTGKRTMTTK